MAQAAVEAMPGEKPEVVAHTGKNEQEALPRKVAEMLTSEESSIPTATSTSATSSEPATLPLTQSSLNPLASSTSIPPPSNSADLSGGTPKLARRSSQFHSSRPAPPSPVPSRRASQINSPALSHRDRASSTSSSAGHGNLGASSSSSGGAGSSGGLGRKLSLSQTNQSAGLSSRNSIAKNRPRSSLGTAMYTGGGDDGGITGLGLKEKQISHSAPSPSPSQPSALAQSSGTEPPASAGSTLSPKASSAFSTTIAHNESSTADSTSISPTSLPASPEASRKPSITPLVIRDYAFPASDDRYHGIRLPIPAAESSSSSRLSSFLASTVSQSDRRSSSAGENKRDKEKGWSFSMLNWRGFMGRKSRSNSRSDFASSGPAEDGSAIADAESEPDITATGGGAEDDYAFESSSEDDEEPYGLYRAAYAFEAEGEHEISLEEGEVVEVKGRGGGEGWVIAVKLKKKDGAGATDEGGGEGKDMVEGLVPEGYLEKVDEEEVRTGLIHAGYHSGQRRTVAPDGISEEPEETSDLETGAGR